MAHIQCAVAVTTSNTGFAVPIQLHPSTALVGTSDAMAHSIWPTHANLHFTVRRIPTLQEAFSLLPVSTDQYKATIRRHFGPIERCAG